MHHRRTTARPPAACRYSRIAFSAFSAFSVFSALVCHVYLRLLKPLTVAVGFRGFAIIGAQHTRHKWDGLTATGEQCGHSAAQTA